MISLSCYWTTNNGPTRTSLPLFPSFRHTNIHDTSSKSILFTHKSPSNVISWNECMISDHYALTSPPNLPLYFFFIFTHHIAPLYVQGIPLARWKYLNNFFLVSCVAHQMRTFTLYSHPAIMHMPMPQRGQAPVRVHSNLIERATRGRCLPEMVIITICTHIYKKTATKRYSCCRLQFHYRYSTGDVVLWVRHQLNRSSTLAALNKRCSS